MQPDTPPISAIAREDAPRLHPQVSRRPYETMALAAGDPTREAGGR